MTNVDRNGTPIEIGTDYVVIGPSLRDLDDGRVLLMVGRQVLAVDALAIAQVLAFGGGGGGGGPHASTHQNGAADEISVAGLSGLLADGQTPLAHKTSHQNGGTDELNVAGLNGLLADAQTPLAHGHAIADVTSLQAALDGKQPLAALLTALAALVTLADKGLYFIGADAPALYDLTAQARTFLAAATAALQRTALGLGTAATFNQGTGASDLVTVTDFVNYLNASLLSYQATSAKNAASGYAGLNASAIVAPAQLPASLTEDADTLQGTTDAGNPGYIPVRHFVRCDTARTLASSASRQALFNSPTNGRLTLETGCYKFEGQLLITAMSTAAASNAQIDLPGAGTATFGTWMWMIQGLDALSANGIASDLACYINNSGATALAVVTGTTGATLRLVFSGTCEITVAGTMIPSIVLATAAAAIVSAGSYFMIERIGSTSVASVGQWD